MILTFAMTTALLLGNTSGPTQEPVDDSTKRAAEDVEVMRRLLVKKLGELWPSSPGDVPTTEAFTVLNGNQSGLFSFGSDSHNVSHSRGFVVPGVGAVFSIDVDLPVYETEGTSKEEPKGDDAWEQARREAQGGAGFQNARAFGRTKTYALDPQAIDAAIAGVVEVLALHGNRIRGLGPGESLTVLLHASSSGRYRSVQTVAPAASADGTIVLSTNAPLLTLSAADVRVVVRLPLEAVRDYLDDRIDRGGVAKRATVTRYYELSPFGRFLADALRVGPR